MPNFWQILNKPSSPSIGNELNNLIIQQIQGGYELLSDHNRVVATVMTDSEHFSFENISYADTTWTIQVRSLPPESEGHGTWITPAPPNSSEDVPTQTGAFTAQAGIGAGEDDAASSANA